MKPDLYTKLVLTVVACALLWLGFQSSVHTVVRAQGPYKWVVVPLGTTDRMNFHERKPE
jgi:hypothetical protein